METVMPLYLLPAPGYWHTLLSASAVTIEAQENFIKSTYRNRFWISGAQGLQLLSVPLLGGRDSHRLYRETRISYEEPWARKHLQAIRSAYGSSPFFEHYAASFFPLYERPVALLWERNWLLLEWVLKQLRMTISLPLTEIYECLPKTSDNRLQTSWEAPLRPYLRPFEPSPAVLPQVSILDLLFNTGPEALHYIGLNK
ncbi:MAG: WbqC family protein [Chitinophagales bacterium]